MMVDGSTPPPHHHQVATFCRDDDARTTTTAFHAPNTGLSTSTTSSPPPADSSATGPPPTPTAVSTSGRSRWMKLRTTVQLSQAMTQVKNKPPLKREDSFLKRFSTRPLPDPNVVEGSSRLAGDGMLKSPFLGVWRSVVNPDENILFYWLSLLTVCLLYNAWTIIVRQAFPELQQGWSTMWFCIDGFTDLVFGLDIAFQFRTGYLEQGLMVCDSGKLAGHYIKSKSFVLDICAITPIDLAQIYFGVMPILRFPRFLKLYRSFRLYYMVESRTIYPNLWRVVNLIHILLLLAHWFGCFYYLLSELEDFVGEWSYRKPVDDYALLSRKYLGSVYWSTLTLTTIGDLATPATNLQYMFTIISYLIGVFIFATIVGQVGTVITNRNASRLEFERLLDGAKLYMRHHKVPRNMQRRVQRWYDYSWSRGRMQGGGDINSALGILPDKLKTELALHVNLKTLKKVSIFQECQPEFLHDLVLKMRAYIFTPGDLICRKGEVAREMFIIADGILEVISETGRVLTQMKAGDFFGEIGILNLDGFNRRTADVRSVGYSELFSLSREDILAAMKDYPEAQDILQTMGRKRLMEARLAANIGRSGNPGEGPPLPAASGGSTVVVDLGDSPARPRSTVTKLKQDVRHLKKILRTRSTASGYASSDQSENIEMKPMKTGAEVTNPDITRRKNVSFKSLIQKIQFKREDSTTSVKSFTEKLTSFRSSKTSEKVESSSTDESADSSTPLNRSLPLLQRVRMLGAQEKRNEMQQQQAGPPGLPAVGGVLKSPPRLINRESHPMRLSPKLDKELTVKETQPPSPRSKTNPFSTMLTSVIPKVTSPKKSSLKGEEGRKSPVALKGARVPPEPATELPLLKKVLLRKVMVDDKKMEDPAKTEEQDPTEDADEESNENAEASRETVSNRVYLEQFSRTLGFKMSEDVPPVAKTRPRLNASSLTPSPSNENFEQSNADSNPEPNESEDARPMSTSPPKGRLSRMMAVREDSDENSVMAEDPFVKSTECQTEPIGSFGLDPFTEAGVDNPQSDLDTALRTYLSKMTKDLETVIKAYSQEQQNYLLKQNLFLKQSQNNRDDCINKLLSRAEETNPYETFEEVSSLGASSISVSEIGEDNQFSKKKSDNGHGYIHSSDEDRDLDDEEVMMLQEKLKLQRKSWPTSVSIRRKIGSTRQSTSLDDETQCPEETDQEELWRLEFPPPPPDLREPTWTMKNKPIFMTVAENMIEEVNPPPLEAAPEPEEEEEKKKGPNDWEVQMLVEQFEENVVMKSHGRRHSSGEALTWDKVLRLRNSVKTTKGHAQGSRAGRKFSLVEERIPMSQSSSYTSLTNAGHDPSVRRKTGPTGRKSSLPTLPQALNMSRWMGMDQAGDTHLDYGHQASMSSGDGSQETVIDMDTRFNSVDSAPDMAAMGTRSPSSPNVSSDRDMHMSLDFSAVPRLSDWPSSPCLPTIREDEQTSATPSKSSPGRSVSHDCLPKRAHQLNHQEATPQDHLDTFHAFEGLFDPSNDQNNLDGSSVILNMSPQSDHQYYSNTRTTSFSATTEVASVTQLKGNPKPLPQGSVVIAIPDFEHQF